MSVVHFCGFVETGKDKDQGLQTLGRERIAPGTTADGGGTACEAESAED